jgi:transposase
MAYNLLAGDREQGYLLPPSVREWLPQGDLAWFIVDSVDQMELRELYRQYREDGWGAAAYDPKMMVGVLLYATARGCVAPGRSPGPWSATWASGWWPPTSSPDRSGTLCRFRTQHERGLEQLFVGVLWLFRVVGLVKLGVVALDGTKVAANASLAANLKN